MYYHSVGDSRFLSRAAAGPAALALAASRRTGLRPSILRGRAGPAMLAGLGADPTVTKAASGVASAATTYALAQSGGAALSAGAYATMGSAAGPIGAAVGLIVGIVVTKLLTKNYLNVAQMNAAEDAEVTVWNQYRGIMGKVAGRQIGLPAMRAIWKGALHTGLFHLNNEKQCFHQGCSKYPGNASLIDITLDGGSKDRNTFPDVLPAFVARRTALVAPQAAMAHPGVVTAPAAPSRAIAIPRGITGRGNVFLQGLGYLGAVAPAKADAVVFIDNFFAPAVAPGSKCSGHPCYWAYPTTAIERQLLYDVADAWLATQGVQTTPYIQLLTPNAPVASPPVKAAPMVRAGASSAAASGAGGAAGPGGSFVGTTLDMVPVTDPKTGVTTYQSPTAKSAMASRPVTAGTSDVGTGGWVLMGLALAFALARPDKQPTRKGPLR